MAPLDRRAIERHKARMRLALGLSILAAFCWATPALAEDETQKAFAALQAQDLRLATIASHMLEANEALCSAKMPSTGILLESADQYSAALAESRFANGEVIIGQIVPGSAAELAGLKQGDAILAISEIAIATLPRQADAPLRDTVFDLLAQHDSAQPLHLRVRRGEAEITVKFIAPEACLALVEIITDRGLAARSDGRVIQVKYALAERLDDEGLAVVFAHELAHSVMQHRRRLELAEAQSGLVSSLSGSRTAKRIAEIEADRLSVHLLANAGFAPHLAVDFWDSPLSRELGSTLFSAHPSRRKRGELIRIEIEQYLPLQLGPTWPGHLLALANQPPMQD